MMPDKSQRKLPEIIIVRNWKEYFGESILIVFSVLFALGLTELITAWHERQQIHDLVANVRAELIHNRNAEEEKYHYDLKVVQNIEAALADENIQRQIVAKGEFHLTVIAPNGVLFRYLNNEAWNVAKSRDVLFKLDMDTAALLTGIYDDQTRVMRVEDEVAKILLSRESRRSENVRETLILIRDNYRGWTLDRAPGLLKRYETAIAQLERK
jgi:hypothetical protein